MKKIILGITLLVILTACGANTYNTEALKFKQVDSNYQLISSEQTVGYNNLRTDLKNLNIPLNKNTSVAVVSTSTANILDEIGINIVAVTDSDKLNSNLRTKLENGEITNLGNPLEPNLETLYQVDADVVIVGSNFPHVSKYRDLSNLIIVPQETYADIFYTTYGLIESFNLDSQSVFNQLVLTDQAAKKLVTNKQLGNVAMLKYAYGNVTIAPNNTYAGTLLTELGIKNMYGDLKTIDIPMDQEKLLSDNPDIIILYAKGDDAQAQLETWTTNPTFENLTAVKNEQIYILQSNSLNADIDSPKALYTLSEDLYGN